MKWMMSLAFLAGAAFEPAPAVAADQFFEHSYAVVIGIDHYPSPKWPQLQYAVKDARAIGAFLAGQNYDEVISLYDQQATKQAILRAMQNRLAPKLTDKDRVLVFFAGHGYTETLGGKDRGYIVPYDGGAESAGYISMEELLTQSEYMDNSRHQLFIMDSCYGGLLADTRGVARVNTEIPGYLKNISDRVARQVITAGGKNQQVLDGGPKGHSFFVDYFLEAVAEGKADLNGDGYITFSELNSYLESRAWTRQQTPMFGNLPRHGAGEYLFRAPGGRVAPPVSIDSGSGGPVRGSGEVAVTPSGGTGPANPPAAPVIRTVSVAVVDNQGRQIPNIPQDNFRIMEAGAPQQITGFHAEDSAPATVALLIEFSNKYRQSSSAAAVAAGRLIDILRPIDYAAVIAFDIKPKIMNDFSLDRTLVRQALSLLQTQSPEANFFDALKDTGERMRDLPGKKAIVVLATGIDTFSRITYAQALAAVRENSVPIYAVAVPMGPAPAVNTPIVAAMISQAKTELQTFAASTSGLAFFPTSVGEYDSAFQTIAAGLHSGYQLSYHSAVKDQSLPALQVAVELVNRQTGGALRITDERGLEIPYKISVTSVR